MDLSHPPCHPPTKHSSTVTSGPGLLSETDQQDSAAGQLAALAS